MRILGGMIGVLLAVASRLPAAAETRAELVIGLGGNGGAEHGRPGRRLWHRGPPL